VPESEILWLHDPSPVNPYGRGHGILQALTDEVTTDEFAAKHTGSMFFNKATPEFVVMDSNATEPDLRTHERHWASRLQGLYKAFRPYFTNRKLEFWQPNQMNLENLTLVPLRKFERDIQLQCWGLPPEQLGVVEKSNRATAEASDFIMETRLIRPRRGFLADEFSMKLAPEYDDRIEVGFVDTTPQDKKLSLDTMKANPAAYTINDWRRLTGDPPVEGELGESYLVPLNSYVTTDPLDNAQRPNQPGAAANEDDEDETTDETTEDEDTDTDEDEDDTDTDDETDDDTDEDEDESRATTELTHA
jgi:hypothetical protein